VAVLGIWGAVALVSIFAPTIVAGSDGTIVPVAGLFAPVGGTIATGFAAPIRPPGRPYRSGAFERPFALRGPLLSTRSGSRLGSGARREAADGNQGRSDDPVA
jgi:hypothetical protein